MVLGSPFGPGIQALVMHPTLPIAAALRGGGARHCADMDEIGLDVFPGVRRLDVVETGRRRRWSEATDCRGGVSAGPSCFGSGVAP